ncbi:DUF7662 domain-containing protein [Mesorhizobium cantuariense]|uniref:DUF7662 domain-containing protein n=1 Tax=Mesorhizobium cantuariense TaxID=1300275 RepID=A0ABV7MVY8_9HYPH
MSKYEPLNVFLRSQSRDHVPMTFTEIERVLNDKLPPSKLHRAWWSNNPSNNVMTKEWLDAGYETESVDVGSEKLVFRRVRKQPSSSVGAGGGAPRRHPIFGSMKGTLTILPGVDLTEPADPDWGKVYED